MSDDMLFRDVRHVTQSALKTRTLISPINHQSAGGQQGSWGWWGDKQSHSSLLITDLCNGVQYFREVYNYGLMEDLITSLALFVDTLL